MKLTLSLKQIYWDMIVNDGKDEEYREITPYWCNRLLYQKPLGIDNWEKYLTDCRKVREIADRTPGSFGAMVSSWQHLLIDYIGLRGHTEIDFTLGYPKRDDESRHMYKIIESITIGFGNPEWGAPKDREVFIIKYRDYSCEFHRKDGRVFRGVGDTKTEAFNRMVINKIKSE